jgi:hypothetical protein
LWRPKVNFQSLRVCSWCWPWLQKSAEEGQLHSAEVILCSILAVGACLCKETSLTCLDVAQLPATGTFLHVCSFGTWIPSGRKWALREEPGHLSTFLHCRGLESLASCCKVKALSQATRFHSRFGAGQFASQNSLQHLGTCSMG